MLALLQRLLIYFPARDLRIEPRDAGLPAGQVHNVTVRADDGLELHGWHLMPDGQTAADRAEADQTLASGDRVVLYFSGNAGHRQFRTDECRVFTRLGCHVLLVDYRGYGDNEGSPSEASLAADAQNVWRYATDERRIAPQRLLLYGESLGGGVAVRLAAEQCLAGTPPGGLVLRSTFSSLVDAGAYHYPWLPVRWVLRDRYPSRDRIAAVTCPVLQIHGARDSIIPLAIGRRLFDAAPAASASGVAKRFVELPTADHNDMPDVAEPGLRRAVQEFLEDLP
jgi:fermentation-respiration switch protein FrsA (DUF1100 family)